MNSRRATASAAAAPYGSARLHCNAARMFGNFRSMRASRSGWRALIQSASAPAFQVGVAVAPQRVPPAAFQLLLTVVAQNLQHPVPGRGPALDVTDQERLVHHLGQVISG
jgi:hypothetical protein